jgi:hypothetical protein
MVRVGLSLVVLGSAIAVAVACAEKQSPTIAPGDDLENDTNDSDAQPPLPPTAPADAQIDAGLYPDGESTYAPMLAQCAACECSAKKGFCFAGGVHFSNPPPSEAGASDAEAACSMVGGGSAGVVNGCNALPSACTANPTCACVLDAIQTQFACYLVCSPDDGYLLVYCPNGP